MAEAKPITASDISSNPAVLQGKKITDSILQDVSIQNSIIANAIFLNIRFTNLTLRNVTFKNSVFDSSFIEKSIFENVLFENCQFANLRLESSSLSEVKFFGGKMTYKGKYEFSTSQTYLAFSSFENVLFENIALNNVSMHGNTGSFFLRNMQNITQGRHNDLISGKNIIAIIDSVTATGGIVNAEDGSIFAVNCNLTKSDLSVNKGTVFIEKCSFSGAVAGKTGVVKDSGGNIQFWGGEGSEWFISGSELLTKAGGTLLSGFTMKPGSVVHIEGTKTPAHVFFDGGSYQVRNQVLATCTISGAKLERLDLQNVTIKKGSWSKSTIPAGMWENVTIYPLTTADRSSITGISTRGLSFPEGSPWTGKAEEVSLREAAKPFNWKPVKAPTADELGVKRPWPVITGAGQPK